MFGQGSAFQVCIPARFKVLVRSVMETKCFSDRNRAQRNSGALYSETCEPGDVTCWQARPYFLLCFVFVSIPKVVWEMRTICVHSYLAKGIRYSLNLTKVHLTPFELVQNLVAVSSTRLSNAGLLPLWERTSCRREEGGI